VVLFAPLVRGVLMRPDTARLTIEARGLLGEIGSLRVGLTIVAPRNRRKFVDPTDPLPSEPVAGNEVADAFVFPSETVTRTHPASGLLFAPENLCMTEKLCPVTSLGVLPLIALPRSVSTISAGTGSDVRHSPSRVLKNS
jgi:hypothetical protein